MQEALQENLLRHDDHPGRSSAMVAAEDKSLRSSDGNKSPDDGQASGQTEYQPRQSYVADLRQALADGKSPILDMDTMTWRSFLEQTLAKFSALLSAAVCYVAAIAWILVAYGEMGLDPSEERPVRGWDLVSFFCALVCVTASCFVGVYKLQKMKYRAVAREVDHMNTLLLRPEGKNDDDGQASGPKPPADLLQASIPSFRQTHDIEGAIYKELVVRKLRAEGVQKGSNLITDAWCVSPPPLREIEQEHAYLCLSLVQLQDFCQHEDDDHIFAFVLRLERQRHAWHARPRQDLDLYHVCLCTVHAAGRRRVGVSPALYRKQQKRLQHRPPRTGRACG